MPEAKEKRIDEITRLCDEAGIPVATLFRKADIPYGTVVNWRKKEPEAFEKYDKLKETIEVLKAEKETAQ